MNNYVYVKGTRYRIKLVDSNNYFYGETDFGKRVIYISKNQDTNTLIDTISHELIHVYFYECGLPYYGDSETLVTFLGSIFQDLSKKVVQVQKYYKNKVGN